MCKENDLTFYMVLLDHNKQSGFSSRVLGEEAREKRDWRARAARRAGSGRAGDAVNPPLFTHLLTPLAQAPRPNRGSKAHAAFPSASESLQAKVPISHRQQPLPARLCCDAATPPWAFSPP